MGLQVFLLVRMKWDLMDPPKLLSVVGEKSGFGPEIVFQDRKEKFG